VPKNDKQEAKRRNPFSQELPDAGTEMGRGLEQRQPEHGMRKDGAQATAQHLNQGVPTGFGPGQRPAQRLNERDCRIEVSPAHGPQKSDQSGERRYRRSGIGKQGDCHISTGEALGHDPGANNRRCQE
jgi:hypothetical protein